MLRVCAVCTRPLLGEGPGNEATNYLHVASDQVETKCERGRELANSFFMSPKYK